MKLSILLVDDDPSSLESTKRILEHAQYSVVCAKSGPEALSLLKSSHEAKSLPDLIVTDVRMPGMSGMEFVEAFQKQGIEIPFIVMTAFGQVEDAVWAMKMGAVDFLLKPFKREALCKVVEQVATKQGAKNSQVKNKSKIPLLSSSGFIGSSRAMESLRMLIDQVARTDASVLILGESGSGKEQVAKRIHELSQRKNEKFVAVNCAAIPENLIESELFGYEKGAFSGAQTSHAGLIESADQGTLLLDEIGDMPLSLQPKLLRVLEDQKVRRLGSTAEKTVNVRILAATHQNLKEKSLQGNFRQDLYYRLDVMTLNVPALRERIEDIPELTQFFLKRYATEYEKKITGIDTEAQAILMAHSWPGNVRELSNVLERAVVLNETGLIQKQDLPVHLSAINAQAVDSVSDVQITIPLGMSLKDIENLMIQKALLATQGDRAQAAKLLGVNERTIYRKISKSKEE